MDRIKAIPYERIEQKNELERELFSKLTPKERHVVKESWLRLIDIISKARIMKTNHPKDLEHNDKD